MASPRPLTEGLGARRGALTARWSGRRRTRPMPWGRQDWGRHRLGTWFNAQFDNLAINPLGPLATAYTGSSSIARAGSRSMSAGSRPPAGRCSSRLRPAEGRAKPGSSRAIGAGTPCSSMRSSLLAMGAQGGAGSAVDQETADGGAAQHFALQPAGGTFYRLVSPGGLAVAAPSTGNAVVLAPLDCTSNAQQWSVMPLPTSNAVYVIANHQTGWLVNDANASMVAGTAVISGTRMAAPTADRTSSGSSHLRRAAGSSCAASSATSRSTSWAATRSRRRRAGPPAKPGHSRLLRRRDTIRSRPERGGCSDRRRATEGAHSDRRRGDRYRHAGVDASARAVNALGQGRSNDDGRPTPPCCARALVAPLRHRRLGRRALFGTSSATSGHLGCLEPERAPVTP